MSYPSASPGSYQPGSYQIDVVGQVGQAYRVTLDNAQLVVEMALLPYLIVLGIELVAALIPGGILGGILAGLAHAIGFLVFGGIFIVRWYRHLLLNEAVGGGLIPPGWADFLVTGIKLGVLVFAGWLILFFIALLLPHLLSFPLAMLGGVALALGSMRVALIFPAAAVERPVGLRTAWDWIAGNFWRLFACALACYLPFIVVQALVGAIAGILPSLFWIVFEAATLAVSFIGAAVIAALLAQLYRDIVGVTQEI